MVLYFSMLMPVNLDARACLKKAFCKMCVTVCGRCCLNEGGVAGYVNRMKVKYAAKWGVQIAGMIFQTRSKEEERRQYIKNTFRCIVDCVRYSTEKIRNLPMRIISVGSGIIWKYRRITDKCKVSWFSMVYRRKQVYNAGQRP